MHHPVDHHDMEEAVAQAVRILRRAERVAVLSGAGVSAESGVPTFRGAGGLWEGHAITDVATPEAFARDPALVWRFYNQRRAGLRGVRPNAGHHALAALEKRLGPGCFTLITQNIDGLHQAAGSRNVLELHGRLSRVRCTACAYRADRPDEDLPERPLCPECQALLRPDIVWFHEILPHAVWRAAREQVEACQCFLVVGTSAIVYPAAGLIEMACGVGAAILEFNMEATAASALADVGLYGPAGELLPAVIGNLG